MGNNTFVLKKSDWFAFISHFTGLWPFSDLHFVFYSLDLLRHQVMRWPPRRKRKAAPHLTKRRGGRKRNWRAIRRKAKRTKGNTERIARRNRRRENMNHLHLLPAPVNPQKVTETTELCTVRRPNIFILQSTKLFCRHCVNKAPHLFLYKCPLLRQIDLND